MESSTDPLSPGRDRQRERHTERETACFKDVSECVMKARYNEAERPCSYLQSIKVMNYWKKKKEAGGATDDTALQRLTKMQSDGPPLKWKYNV